MGRPPSGCEIPCLPVPRRATLLVTLHVTIAWWSRRIDEGSPASETSRTTAAEATTDVPTNDVERAAEVCQLLALTCERHRSHLSQDGLVGLSTTDKQLP